MATTRTSRIPPRPAWALAALLSTALAGDLALADEVTVPLERETLAVPSGLDGWRLAWQGAIVEMHTLHWVPGAESVDDTSELFTVQRLVAPPEMGAGQYAGLLLESLRHSCPGLQASSSGDRDDALYEWRVAGCDNMRDQHELVRVLRTGDYLFRVAYKRRTAAIADQSREHWLEVLRQVRVVRSCDAGDQGLSAIPLRRLLGAFQFNEVPGMRLAFAHTSQPGSHAESLLLVSSGFPADHRWDVYVLKVQTAEATPVARSVVADTDGILRCPDKSQLAPTAAASAASRDLCDKLGPGAVLNMKVRSQGYQRGLPVVMAARSTEGEHSTYAKVVPTPIEGSSGACRMALELTSTDARTFVAYGTGFPADEAVQLRWSYGGNAGESLARTDSAGAFTAAINHPGQASGPGKWDSRLEAAATGCRVTVRYRWGEAGMQP